MSRVAVVQRPPVFLQRGPTLERAVDAVAEAAAAGARLVVFPETWVPGYPAWVWRLRPGADMGLAERLHAQLRAEAVSLAHDDLAPLRRAARLHEVSVVCGIEERDTAFSGGTLYNSVVVIGPDGSVLNRHRKAVATGPERMVWGGGDASGVRVVDTPCGRVGALVCWENYMPLARCALYAQGIDIHVAPTYDQGQRWTASMQHIAREGGCWVVGSGCAFQARDLIESVPAAAELFRDPDEWVNDGDSVVVAPGGKVVAGPLHREHGIVYADIDLERVGVARRSLDVMGHYARPDLYALHVNNQPARPVTFGEPPASERPPWTPT